MQEAFGIEENKIKPLGVPRTDIFFDEDYKDDCSSGLESFSNDQDSKRVIMYAPTFRGINAKKASFPMDMIDYDLIGQYLLAHESIMLSDASIC